MHKHISAKLFTHEQFNDMLIEKVNNMLNINEILYEIDFFVSV